MALKKTLNTKILYNVIYELCKKANCILPYEIYEKLSKKEDIDKSIKAQILQNAYLAQHNSRPLCQDCGQVVVFLEIGQDVILEGKYINDVINKAIADCYKKEFYRKSIVIDGIKDRANTNSNTPSVIHAEITKGNKIKILLALKGGGAENTSRVKMFNPTATKEEIYDFIKETADLTKGKACPPMSIGVGIGGTIEHACYLAKKALFFGEELDIKIKDTFEIKMLTSSTHIACMPVCVNTNCHSARHASCEIIFKNDGYQIKYKDKKYKTKRVEQKENYKKIRTNETETIKNLKKGEKISLSGTIYTARDMAHQRIVNIIKNGKPLPFELKNSIIFYAGPCPKNENEIIGPVGPTTSNRMNSFAPILFQNGQLAAIGKGERDIKDGIYFQMTGGVASLIKECVKKAELIAFEDLGAEAIYKLEVSDVPLVVS